MPSTLLANIHASLRKLGVVTTITKPSGTPGRINMSVSVPLRKQLFDLEWKSIQIDFINIGSGSLLQRVNVLADVDDATEVLDLKFRNDKFRTGQTIKGMDSVWTESWQQGMFPSAIASRLDLATFFCGILMAICLTRLRDSPLSDVTA
ncbi:MAG: hypothetical protein J3R72DRAFT_499348 [Linnemannia gamsii]|nr:MAG: hypothetical protein J3R72DRAFT_499348 [Linnemannia gamsii]